jgi:DMSO/TMAO reductase YedYZ molybdopterin-dependent catalytic subunit
MQMSPHATHRLRVAAHELTDRVTPTSDVFVLAHFGVARIEPAAWQLQVTGMVSRPAVMSLHQLRELPKVELEQIPITRHHIQRLRSSCGSLVG